MRFSFAEVARFATLLIFSQLASAGGCGPGIPPVDSCENPIRAGTIQQIEVGENDEDEFRVVAPGGTLTKEVGGQGFTMLPVRFRFSGSEVPECLEVEARVTVRGESAVVSTYQLRTYGDDQTVRDTEPLYLILDRQSYFGDGELTVRSLNAEYTLQFKFDGEPPDNFKAQLTPMQLAITPGDSALFDILRVNAAEEPFVATSNISGLSLPIEPYGARVRNFRIRAAETIPLGTVGKMTIDHAGAPVEIEIQVIAPTEPAASSLSFREIFAPRVEAINDWSCDDRIDDGGDQFIELINRSASSLELQGLELVADNIVAGTLPKRSVGAGETVVVFAGTIGTSTTSTIDRCETYDGRWAGDGPAVGGGGFDLRGASTIVLRNAAGVEINRVTLPFSETGYFQASNYDLQRENQPQLESKDYVYEVTPGFDELGNNFSQLNPL